MKAKKMFNVLTYKIAKSIILPILFLWSIGTVFTLYQNQSVKKKLTKKQQECLNLKRNIGDLHSLYRGLSELEGKKIPIITLNTVNPNNNVVIKTSFNENKIVLLYSHFDCASCVNTTFNCLNKFANKNSGKIQIVAIANTRDPVDIWKQTRAVTDVPVFHDLNDSTSVFSQLKLTFTPIILFVLGKENRIIYAKKGSNDATENEAFFKKLENWM